MAALALVNIFEAGYPMIFSNWPLVIDLRTGAFAGGSGEISVLNAAAGQMSLFGGSMGIAMDISVELLRDFAEMHLEIPDELRVPMALTEAEVADLRTRLERVEDRLIQLARPAPSATSCRRKPMNRRRRPLCCRSTP